MKRKHNQSIRQDLVRLIYTNKKITPTRLLAKSFEEIGFDTADLVEIILEVEKAYHIHIPDEVPLNKVDDFVAFLSAHTQRTDA